jgi:uncharacterized membrane protein YhaH (DUF805 family)
VTGVIIIYLAILVVVIAGVWKAFEKAGAPGWAAIIPIYNYYVMVKMAGKEGWWVILLFIPLVNLVVVFIVMIEIAKNFGKSTGFGVGMVLLSVVFWPILGFGDAEWEVAPVNV